MSLTFSLFEGTNIEALKKVSVVDILGSLPNNTSKAIKPKDIRDAFLSIFSESAFKVTKNQNGDEYIGIDTLNPDNRDFNKKILLGKKSVNNVDVMSSDLLNSDTDIFIYTTKEGNVDTTKISFLAGSDTDLFLDAPYIEANKENDFINLNINNDIGSININSVDGRVSINNINFPKIAESLTDAQNGKILKYKGNYPTGKLVWEELSFDNLQIGNSSSQTDIYGNSVLLNGYPLEFVDDGLMPVAIGAFDAGTSFQANSFNGQNYPITEIIRGILYPYIPPILELDILNRYVEVGVETIISFSYSLTTFARYDSENISGYVLRDGNIDSTSWEVLTNNGELIGNPNTTFAFTYNHTFNSNVVGTYDFSLFASNVSDIVLDPSVNMDGFGYSVSNSVDVVYPFIYRYDESIYSDDDLDFLLTDSLSNKILGSYDKINISILNSTNNPKYLYFLVPIDNPISSIRDNNGYEIYTIENNTLLYISNTFPIINTHYGEYYIYRTLDKVSLPISSYNFEFNF